MLEAPFTMPERYVSHRWLSVYDVAMSTSTMYKSFYSFYYGFVTKNVQSGYKELLEKNFDHNVSLESRKRIRQIHQELEKKDKRMTDEGKKKKM